MNLLGRETRYADLEQCLEMVRDRFLYDRAEFSALKDMWQSILDRDVGARVGFWDIGGDRGRAPRDARGETRPGRSPSCFVVTSGPRITAAAFSPSPFFAELTVFSILVKTRLSRKRSKISIT
jgi:hypothetical protein